MTTINKGPNRTYLSCADTAKLIRAALKRAFPAIKFTVRSHTYSGGASINVGWTDGPIGKAVEAIAKQYQGGGFDGMIDLKYSVSSWLLPDGSATVASCDGTTGSMGTVPPTREWMPEPGAKLVRFGADFVFCNRDYSAGFLRRGLEAVQRKLESVEQLMPVIPDDAILVSAGGYAYLNPELAGLRPADANYDLQSLLTQEMSRRALGVVVPASMEGK